MFQLDPLQDSGLTYLQVAGMHLGSLTHLEEIFQVGFVYDDVDGHFPPESCVQEVLEDVNVREHVHDHRNHLPRGRKETSAMEAKRISRSGFTSSWLGILGMGIPAFLWRCLIHTKHGSKS